MKVISWNVNGIRAAAKKGFLQFLEAEEPDVLCLQETKAQPEQLAEELISPGDYRSYWASAERKGYSGVAVYSKQEPQAVHRMGIERFDAEGRLLILEYPSLTLMTGYFPNSQEGGKRLDYKLDYCENIHKICDDFDGAGRNLLLCGDFNIAHKAIDLENPKANEKNAGYLPEERAWMDAFTGAGYIDSFRMFTGEPRHYTWWSYRANARARNVGWRIDYHAVNPRMRERVGSSDILADVMGSDHAPIRIQLDL
jgi:exodeoxyribonuclease-3